MSDKPRSNMLWPLPPNPCPEDWVETDKPAQIRVTWEQSDGRWKASEVTIRAVAEGDEITATRLHNRIQFGAVFQEMRWGQQELGKRPEMDERDLEELRKLWTEPRPGRPREKTLDHWERVADAYYRGRDAGAIRRTVAREFNVSPGKAKNWIAEARRLGLIEGEPT